MNKGVPYILASIFLIVFMIICILLAFDSIKWLDVNVYNSIISHNAVLTDILKVITEFGDAIILIIITLLILLVFKERTIGFLVAINLVLSFGLGQIVKLFFLRERPTLNVLIDIGGYSFPSGHSMVSIAFYGFLIYLCYKKIENKLLKWFLIILQTLLILAIGYSRIYLGAHFPSDVIAGYLLGLSFVIIYIKAFADKIVTRNEINDEKK